MELYVQIYWESLVGASNAKLTSDFLIALSDNSFKDYWCICIKINTYFDAVDCRLKFVNRLGLLML
jgi:hypothetical protein